MLMQVGLFQGRAYPRPALVDTAEAPMGVPATGASAA